MLTSLKLFMVLIGCKPPVRNTEQHDIFFGIGENLQQLIPDIISFWPEAKSKIHLDAWCQLSQAGGYDIKIYAREQMPAEPVSPKLFFINLGGYKPGEFEEFHYKIVVVGKDKGDAIAQAKKTAFFRHTGFAGANSHVDDKYGIDVDDIYEIGDILPPAIKNKFTIILLPATEIKKDQLHLGYMKLDKL